jgi:hypothetical protein
MSSRLRSGIILQSRSLCCVLSRALNSRHALGVSKQVHPSHVLGHVRVQLMPDSCVLLRSPSPFLRNR